MNLIETAVMAASSERERAKRKVERANFGILNEQMETI
jgi:hypothetical protein